MCPLKSCYLGTLLLVTCAALAQCALEPAIATDNLDSVDTKSSDDSITMQKRPSFFVGSRYGRSGGASASLLAPSKMRRLNVVPRNDRFFLGSRYGKRAGENVSPVFDPDSDEPALAATLTNSPTLSGTSWKTVTNSKPIINNSPFMMSCIYTGVKNFYRCNNIEEINNIINQLTTGQGDDDAK